MARIDNNGRPINDDDKNYHVIVFNKSSYDQIDFFNMCLCRNGFATEFPESDFRPG